MLRHGLQMARGLCQLLSDKFSVGLHRNIMKHLLPINATGHAWSPSGIFGQLRWRHGLSPPPSRVITAYRTPPGVQRCKDCMTNTAACAKWRPKVVRKERSLEKASQLQPHSQVCYRGRCLSRMLQAKARLFTRNIEEQGAGFEYVVFINKEEKTCVCVFQAGHLLEGPPGHVHGGAIATIIDSVTGTHATYISGPVMTANLTINYRSPIPLGSVVLVHSALDKVEGRKTFISCQVTSSDGAKLHTEATGLFVSINVSHLFGA